MSIIEVHLVSELINKVVVPLASLNLAEVYDRIIVVGLALGCTDGRVFDLRRRAGILQYKLKKAFEKGEVPVELYDDLSKLIIEAMKYIRKLKDAYGVEPRLDISYRLLQNIVDINIDKPISPFIPEIIISCYVYMLFTGEIPKINGKDILQYAFDIEKQIRLGYGNGAKTEEFTNLAHRVFSEAMNIMLLGIAGGEEVTWKWREKPKVWIPLAELEYAAIDIEGRLREGEIGLKPVPTEHLKPTICQPVIIGIFGESGGGKTVLIRSLVKYYFVQGYNIIDLTFDDVYEHLKYYTMREPTVYEKEFLDQIGMGWWRIGRVRLMGVRGVHTDRTVINQYKNIYEPRGVELFEKSLKVRAVFNYIHQYGLKHGNAVYLLPVTSISTHRKAVVRLIEQYFRFKRENEDSKFVFVIDECHILLRRGNEKELKEVRKAFVHLITNARKTLTPVIYASLMPRQLPDEALENTSGVAWTTARRKMLEEAQQTLGVDKESTYIKAVGKEWLKIYKVFVMHLRKEGWKEPRFVKAIP